MLSKSLDISKRSQERRHILLIDPRALTRACVAGFLRSGRTYEFRSAGRAYEVAEAARVDDLSALEWSQLSVDLAIMNIGAASVRDVQTRDEVRRLCTSLDGVPVVLFTESEDIDEIRDALRLGVRGYIPTSLKGAVTLAALQLVLAGGTFVPAEAHANGRSHVTESSASYAPPASGGLAVQKPPEAANLSWAPIRRLTQREMDVLHLLRQGKANKAIAYQLSVSEGTVKVHIQHIMRKLKATNRTHIVCLANRYFGEKPAVG
jgi:DNA-binding NarL/FixJ family response regulator